MPDVDVRRVIIILLLIPFLIPGCAEVLDPEADAFDDHEEVSDLVWTDDSTGKSDENSDFFTRNYIVSDSFFTDTEYISEFGLQRFLEESPYGRSWLADVRVDGLSMAELIVEHAREEGINPLLLLARVQVEQSLVSRTGTQRSLNSATGCGCPDNAPCSQRYQGLRSQLSCSAFYKRRHFEASQNGEGIFTAGVAKRTLDPITVTPVNHATASLYTYTPWVLERRGGNWLFWNVTRRFVRHIESLGLREPPELEPFIGKPCTQEDDCNFTEGDRTGFCLRLRDDTSRGFCSITCQGFCPDHPQYATTFCIASSNPNLGICVPKAERINSHCGDIPGAVTEFHDRFIGESSAPSAREHVCVP